MTQTIQFTYTKNMLNVHISAFFTALYTNLPYPKFRFQHETQQFTTVKSKKSHILQIQLNFLFNIATFILF